MTQVTWVYRSFLFFLLPLMLVCGWVLFRHYLWQRRTAHQLGINGSLHNFSLKRKASKVFLYIVGLFFLVLALARPQWGETEQKIAQESRDVLIALDVSRSMLAQDISPSRLERTKMKIKKLLSSLTAERVSLMNFSGFALVQCPFTTDTDAFINFLDLAEVSTISTGTTALDTAIGEAIKRFKEVPGRKQKLMVIFTDGEDFSQNLADLQKEAQQIGLHIFIIGVGTPEGAPIPLYDENGQVVGHQKDENDAVVVTRLNESLLNDVARETGGVHLRLTDNDDDIITLKKVLTRFEKERFDDTTITHKHERYLLFAILSALSFLLEWLL